MFGIEGKFFKGLELLSNLIIANLLFVLCCIPLVTAGAAKTALETILTQIMEGEEGHIVKEFLKCFKKHFGQATSLWLMYLFITLIAVSDFYAVSASANLLLVGVVCFVAATVLILTNMAYSYATGLFCRMEGRLRSRIKNAFILSVKHLPRTALILLIEFLPGLLILFFTGKLILICLFYIVIGCSAGGYLKIKLLKNIPNPHQTPKIQEK